MVNPLPRLQLTYTSHGTAAVQNVSPIACHKPSVPCISYSPVAVSFRTSEEPISPFEFASATVMVSWAAWLGIGAADGAGDGEVPEPPQAVRASAASTISGASTRATVVDDPRFP